MGLKLVIAQADNNYIAAPQNIHAKTITILLKRTGMTNTDTKKPSIKLGFLSDTHVSIRDQ